MGCCPGWELGAWEGMGCYMKKTFMWLLLQVGCQAKHWYMSISRDWGRLLWLKRERQDKMIGEGRAENSSFLLFIFIGGVVARWWIQQWKKKKVKKQPTRTKQKPWSYKIRSIFFGRAENMKLWELYCCYVAMRQVFTGLYMFICDVSQEPVFLFLLL